MPPLDLPHQYAISTNASLLPSEWPQRSMSGVNVATHPALPVIDVRNPEGIPIGYLLGWPVSPEGVLLEREVVLDGDPTKTVYQHGGMWAFVYLTGAEQHLYMDPSASLGAVCVPSAKMVGSTINLIPETLDTRRNDSLVEHLDVFASNRWYPFGLTPRFGCYRVLPNHRLDLRSWILERHWPEDGLSADPDIALAVERIAEGMKATARGFIGRVPVKAALTAGRDTRMILSVIRDQLDRVPVFTVEAAQQGTDIDLHYARKIARRFGLTHITTPWISSSERDIRDTFIRIGEARAGALLHGIEMQRRTKPDHFDFTGLLGEVGRAYLWREDDREDARFSAKELAKLAKSADGHPDVDQAADAWLRNVPEMDPVTLLDLFYLENRIGCWAGPGNYLGVGVPPIWILNRRDIIQAMLRLPFAYKRRAQLAEDVIRREWPELLRFPFNRASPAIRVRRKLAHWIERA